MRSDANLIACGIFALGLCSVSSHAEATIVWSFSSEFSGSGGTLSGPVVVTLDDGNNSGSVNIMIDTSSLSLSEKITGLYLNLNPALDPDSLAVSFPGDNTTPHGAADLGTNEFKADGDGKYDILIEWDESGIGRFLKDMTDTIAIALAGLVEEDFFYLSEPDGGHGPFHAALRVQSLGPNGNGSGWFFPTGGFESGNEIPVPEPSSLALFGFGLAGLALAIRGRRKISWQFPAFAAGISPGAEPKAHPSLVRYAERSLDQCRERRRPMLSQPGAVGFSASARCR